MITESRVVDGVIVLRMLRLLSQPIEKSDAYKLGLIDADGKNIKKPSTAKEKDAYTILNRFVFKLKNALTRSPDRNARKLLSLAAAIAILRENEESVIDTYTDQDIDTLLDMYETDEKVIEESHLLEHNLVSFKTFREEVSVGGSVGGAGIDGIGVGPKGEPGRDPVMQPLIRRKKKEKEKWPQLNK